MESDSGLVIDRVSLAAIIVPTEKLIAGIECESVYPEGRGPESLPESSLSLKV